MKNSLTEGSILKNIVSFSLPYLLSVFLQTLYGMADLFIIGRFYKTEYITAVSIGSQVMHVITLMIIGVAMGATITIGKSIGAKDNKKTAKSIGNTVTLFALSSFVLTFVLYFLINPIVSVMSVPAESIIMTKAYLKVCFTGIPLITGYNIICAILRGMGDSKSPMYFVGIACIFNILLDYLLIGYFKLGTVGAALGTIISQGLSVIISLIIMHFKKMGIKLTKEDFIPNKFIIKLILKIGIPISIQDGIIQISFLVITIIANMRGLYDAAAVGIVEKMMGIMFLIPSSMLSTVSALSAQNIGAKKYRRAKLTLFYAVLICIGFGFIISIAVQFIAPQLVGIFENNKNVILMGSLYLKSYIWDTLFAGIHFCFSGYFCAIERSYLSFIHNALSTFLVRIPVTYFTSKAFKYTLYPMGFASPLGSLFSVIFCFAFYIYIGKDLVKK